MKSTDYTALTVLTSVYIRVIRARNILLYIRCKLLLQQLGLLDVFVNVHSLI